MSDGQGDARVVAATLLLETVQECSWFPTDPARAIAIRNSHRHKNTMAALWVVASVLSWVSVAAFMGPPPRPDVDTGRPMSDEVHESPRSTQKKMDPFEHYCAGCNYVVDQIEKEILATPDKRYVLSRFRLDEKKEILYERTEERIEEVIESVCDPIRKRVFRKLSDALVEVVDDPETQVPGGKRLANSLHATCQHIVRKFEDELTLIFHRNPPDFKARICGDIVKACKPSPGSESGNEKAEL
ncbi:Saposin B-type domain-containing protein [Plasmodiophora brassicae]